MYDTQLEIGPTSKKDMLTLLTYLFKNNKRREFIHLFYAGHGCKSTGDWATSDGLHVSLEDIIEIIRNYTPQGRVIIEMDSCYSGCWCDRLLEMERQGSIDPLKIRVVAHCAKDKSADFGSYHHFWQS